MSAENDAEVIVFPIRFEVDPQNIEEITEAVDEATEVEKKPSEELKPTDTKDELELAEEQEEGLEEREENAEAIDALTEFVKTTDRQGLKTLSTFAKNPGAMIEGQLLKTLGKAGVYGALAAAIIAVILSVPDIINTIVKALAVKGGPLNQDFHRFFEDENQLGFSRELQYRRAVGLDVVITNDSRGFLLTDPAFVGNSLVDVDTTRSIRLSTQATQYGYTNSM